ncbi:hypothetical protein niasHS_007458 [Heterodera schachtii]|uniref:Uncharacterized protein n=1 Tax=Heterodera schachtii TaxID=97005 RepID=A0ABD2JXQ7_HETSC
MQFFVRRIHRRPSRQIQRKHNSSKKSLSETEDQKQQKHQLINSMGFGTAQFINLATCFVFVFSIVGVFFYQNEEI